MNTQKLWIMKFSVYEEKQYKNFSCVHKSMEMWWWRCHWIIETDCTDSTDEATFFCKNNMCDSGFFRCSYGACVKNETSCGRSTKTDAKTDKEAQVAEIARVTQATASSCRITRLPKNGFVQYLYLYLPGVHLKLDDQVLNLVKIKYTCKQNHRIVGNETNVCRNGMLDGFLCCMGMINSLCFIWTVLESTLKLACLPHFISFNLLLFYSESRLF